MLARRYARPLIAYALAHFLALPSPAIAESTPTATLAPASTPGASPTPLSSASAIPADLTPTAATPMPTPFAMLEPPNEPKEPKRPFTWSRLGYGTVAAGENVVYVPAKLAYAGMGIFVGAATWVVAGGKPKLAKRVWKLALGGDYMITPSMVEGKEPVEFSGTVETEKIVARSSFESATTPIPTPAPSGGGKPPHRPWWHLWGRKNANATPTPEPSPTPAAGPANSPSGTRPRHWWQFWKHKAAQAASPIPSPTPAPVP
jgi:hypothetical protein